MLENIITTENIYVLGVLFSLIVILVIDIADRKSGIINKFDKPEDIITITLLLLSSWLSVFIILIIILNSEKIRNFSEKLNRKKKHDY